MDITTVVPRFHTEAVGLLLQESVHFLRMSPRTFQSDRRGFMCAWLPLWMTSYPHGLHVYHLNRTHLPITQNVTAMSYGNGTTKYPVLCFCENYAVCGCDDIVAMNSNNRSEPVKYNTTYAMINGTAYALLNGTLVNGTTAPGGAEMAVSSGNSLGFGAGSWLLSILCLGSGVLLLLKPFAQVLGICI